MLLFIFINFFSVLSFAPLRYESWFRPWLYVTQDLLYLMWPAAISLNQFCRFAKFACSQKNEMQTHHSPFRCYASLEGCVSKLCGAYYLEGWLCVAVVVCSPCCCFVLFVVAHSQLLVYFLVFSHQKIKNKTKWPVSFTKQT